MLDDKPPASSPGSAVEEDTSDWDTRLAEWFVRRRWAKTSSQKTQSSNALPRPSHQKNGYSVTSRQDGPNGTSEPGRSDPAYPDLEQHHRPSAEKIHVVEIVRVEAPTETPTKRFACSACQQHFSTQYLTKLHINSKHLMLALYRCAVCGERFCTPRRRRRHFLLKHYENSSPLLCPYVGCHRSFSNPVLLAEHRASTHRKDIQGERGASGTLRCERCGLDGFSHRVRLEKHILTCHSVRDGQGSFVCGYSGCTHHSPSYAAFRRHLARHKDVSQQFACDRVACSARFSVYELLLEHKRQAHPKPSSLRCTDCNQIFITRTGLQRHCQKRHGVSHSSGVLRKSSVCPLEACGKRFSTMFNLRDHLVHFHLRLKTYCCKLCKAKSFTSRNAARRHVKQQHSTKHIQGVDADAAEACKRILETVYTLEAVRHQAAVARVCTALQKGLLCAAIVLNPGGYGIQKHKPGVLESVAMVTEDASLDPPRKKRFQNNKQCLQEASTEVLDGTEEKYEIVVCIDHSETEPEESSNTYKLDPQGQMEVGFPDVMMKPGVNGQSRWKGAQQCDFPEAVHSRVSHSLMSPSSSSAVIQEWSLKENEEKMSLVAQRTSHKKEASALHSRVVPAIHTRAGILASNDQKKVRQGSSLETHTKKPSPCFSHQLYDHHIVCEPGRLANTAVSHTARETNCFSIPDAFQQESRTLQAPSQGVQSIPITVVSIKNRRTPSIASCLHRREKKRTKY